VVASEARPWLFVEIETSDGTVGVGEGSQSRLDKGVAAQIDQMRPGLLGKEPSDLINRLTAQLSSNQFADRITYTAHSAVEHALWDLTGKELGCPVWRLLGGKARDVIKVYANLALATRGLGPEAFEDAASRAVTSGHRAVKIYPLGSAAAAGRVPTRSYSSSELMAVVDRVRATRDAVGADVEVLVDCSWSLRTADAVRLCTALEPLGIHWFEEPFPGSGARQLADLRRKVATRIAAGEQLQTVRQFQALIGRRAVDVVMPDVKWVGGIAAARAVAAIADAADVEVAPHNMSGPVATAASIAVAATAPGITFLELPFGADGVAAELIGGELPVVNEGTVHVSDAPGLGVSWYPAVAEARAVRD